MLPSGDELIFPTKAREVLVELTLEYVRIGQRKTPVVQRRENPEGSVLRLSLDRKKYDVVENASDEQGDIGRVLVHHILNLRLEELEGLRILARLA